MPPLSRGLGPGRHDPHRLFLAALPAIRRITSVLARRYHLEPADAEDFASWSIVRLLDDDCAVLRRFHGRSALGTYLMAVICNLFRDYRNTEWGRWRPSAAARRLGPLGIELDRLINRDGMGEEQAVRLLAQARRDLEAELRRLARSLPRRVRRREVGPGSLPLAVAAEPADDRIDREEAERARARALEAMQTAIGALPLEERRILRMRYWEGRSIADVARALDLEQKPLYRRLESIQRRLHQALLALGVDRSCAALALELDRA
jgi:RNA polymerase sigma factor (sigma-70 family)